MSGVPTKAMNLFQMTASRLVRAAGLPTVTAENKDPHVGQSASFTPDFDMTDIYADPPEQNSPGRALKRQAGSSGQAPHASPADAGQAAADMNASVDILAEQMLTLVEIVSAQEKEIKALKEQCRRFEEQDQAIMVGFTTFFHVLAAKRVAKLEEISAVLQHISAIAEKEERPEGSIRFLRDLASMLADQTAEKPGETNP